MQWAVFLFFFLFGVCIHLFRRFHVFLILLFNYSIVIIERNLFGGSLGDRVK